MIIYKIRNKSKILQKSLINYQKTFMIVFPKLYSLLKIFKDKPFSTKCYITKDLIFPLDFISRHSKILIRRGQIISFAFSEKINTEARKYF